MMSRLLLALVGVILLESGFIAYLSIETKERVERMEGRLLGACVRPSSKDMATLCRAIEDADRKGVGMYDDGVSGRVDDLSNKVDDLSGKVDGISNRVDDIANRLNI